MTSAIVKEGALLSTGEPAPLRQLASSAKQHELEKLHVAQQYRQEQLERQQHLEQHVARLAAASAARPSWRPGTARRQR